MTDEIEVNRKIFSLFCGILMVFVTLNIIIFSAPVVRAEGGELEIHLNELGFSTEFTSTPSTTLYCPRFEQSSNWETQVVLSNPSENIANININYYNILGGFITQIEEHINNYGTIDFISLDHDILEESGSILISSDIPIFGNVIYYSSYCAAAEPLQTTSSPILYCPGFYQSVDWETWICVNRGCCKNKMQT